MAVENFDPEPGRDLGPLIHALRRHGGTLTFANGCTSSRRSLSVLGGETQPGSRCGAFV